MLSNRFASSEKIKQKPNAPAEQVNSQQQKLASASTGVRRDPYSGLSPAANDINNNLTETENSGTSQPDWAEQEAAVNDTPQSIQASAESYDTRTEYIAAESDKVTHGNAEVPEPVESEYGELPIAFQGELMLHHWAESSGRPRTVTFRLSDDEPEHPFRSMRSTMGKISGQRFMAVLVMLDDDEKPVKEVAVKPYGKYARELHRAGWFFDRRVLNAIGSEDEFKDWLVSQSCVVCGTQGPSSVLLSRGYSGIPCCNMHQHVEPSVLASHQPKVIRNWAILKAVELFGVDSLGYVPPATFIKKMRSMGIENTIPSGYLSIFENEHGGLSIK